jgi:hypothetical protein
MRVSPDSPERHTRPINPELQALLQRHQELEAEWKAVLSQKSIGPSDGAMDIETRLIELGQKLRAVDDDIIKAARY